MSFKRLLFLLFIIVSVSAYAGGNFAIKTVVIDAGHGGKDPGATGPGKTNEKDVSLAVALKLGDYIQKNFPDVTVIYTRKTDVFIELHERAELANKSKADLFIAIHCNSNNSPTVYGTSTYVLGLHRTEANLEVAKRENSVILLEDDRDKNYEFDPNTPEGHIIMSMKQNAFLDHSIDIASKIEGQYEGTAKRKSLGVKQAGFYVIYKTAMPSLLSEIGFISNPTEEKFLASDKGQDQIASSLFKAFKDYKFEMENSEGEQFAYEEAKRKAQSADTAVVTHKEASVVTTNPVKPVVKEVKPIGNEKPAVAPTPVVSEPEPDNITATLLSGRKIRKPLDNASGGGISLEAEKPVEPAPVKKENKPAPETVVTNPPVKTTTTEVKPEKHEAVVENLAPKAEVNPAPKPAVIDTPTQKHVAESKPVETKQPVVEAKKITAGNSGGATIETEKPVSKPVVTENKPLVTETKPAKPESKPVVTETKPVKTEPKPEKTPAPVKTEEKPVASRKPEKKPAANEETTHPAVKTASSNAESNVMTYKIQLIALKGPMKPTEVTKVTKALGEITDETIATNGLIRYYSGNSKTLAEAKSKLAIANSVGYKDAFIVGFKNGVRFGPEKLKAMENQ